ncbi:hypothetical protein F66182_4605 [Fusarium sp. NRRL 66182]|nr:hypothetical protein F66182_4605 [Fusarium sp. NRRL 66182]
MPQILDNQVGAIGYGMMGLSWRPNPAPLEQTLDAMRTAVTNGCTVWSGAEFYGTPEYNSMTIIKAYFTKYPEDAEKVTIVIKGGFNTDNYHCDGSPEFTRKSIDNIISQLGGVKKLDAFAPARRDHNVPFDVTLGVIQKEYIDTGKIGGVALSECSAATVNEAAKIVKVVAAEVECSLFSPDILKNGVAAACAQHNIPILAYSPIGRGMLSGRFTDASQFKEHGGISVLPRLQPEAIQHNLKLVKQVEAIAEKRGLTPAQLAISWVRSLSGRDGLPTIIPIPGATTSARVQENSESVTLSEEEMTTLGDLVDNFEVYGDRYPESMPKET